MDEKDINEAGIEPLLGLDDTARLIRRSHWSLRRDIKAGHIRCIRLGRRILIEASEIRRFIDHARVRDTTKTNEQVTGGSK